MLKKNSWLFVLLLSSCSILHIGTVHTLEPEEVIYWSKSGYTYEQTKRFILDVCDYQHFTASSKFDRDYIWKETVRFQNCMLDNGFVYMEKVYNPESYNGPPIYTDFCMNVDGYLYNRPACQSYRERHPNWNRTVYKIRNFLGAYWL